MIKTLQRKFVLTAMSAVTLLLLLLLGAINAANFSMVSRRLDRTLELLGAAGGDIGNLPPVQRRAPEGPRLPFGIPNPPRNDYDIFMSSNYFVVRFNPQGEAVFVDVSRTSTVSEEEAAALAEAALESGQASGASGHFRYRIEKSPLGTAAVFLDTSGEAVSLLQVLGLSVIAGLACWGLMLILVILLSKRAIRPIAENIQRQKQFVTNAGHEIKTPLAIIQSNTEAMELYTGESKWSRRIKEQTVRLNGLVQDLLLLARMDEGAAPGEPANFSLSELLAGSLEEFAQSMESKGLALTTQIQPDVAIHADREQIRQLLSILLDNCVKYAAPQGQVEVRLERADSHVKLQMQNTCEALPQVPPEKLFDRFYRADAARTQKSGGYGIGLSVARSLAQANRATVAASYVQPNAVRLTVTFK